MNKQLALYTGLLAMLPISLLAIAFIFWTAMAHEPLAPGWKHLAQFSDLQPDQPVAVPADRTRHGIYIVRLKDGRIKAFDRETPLSSRCQMSWSETAVVFHDPCGGAQFSIEGEYITGPAQRTLDQYPVRIQGDDVAVDLKTKIKGHDF